MSSYLKNLATKKSDVKIVKPYIALQLSSQIIFLITQNKSNSGKNKTTFLNMKKLYIIGKTTFL